MKGYRRLRVGEYIKPGDGWYTVGKGFINAIDSIGTQISEYSPAFYRPLPKKARKVKKLVKLETKMNEISTFITGNTLNGIVLKDICSFIRRNYRRK